MKIGAYLRLIRIVNDIMVGLGVIIGEIIALNGIPPITDILLGFITGFFISASVMILNDIADLEIDKINNPSKPLVKGDVKIKEAYYLAFIYLAIGIISSLLSGLVTFIIALLFWFIGYTYNFHYKKTGLFGNSLVSLSVAIPFLYGSLIVNRYDINIFILFTAAYLTNMYREIIKGILDVRGDSLYNVKTLAVKRGVEKAFEIGVIFILSAIVISILPLVLITIKNQMIYFNLITFTDLILAITILIPLIKRNNRGYLLSKRICLIGMMLGMFAFLFASTI